MKSEKDQLIDEISKNLRISKGLASTSLEKLIKLGLISPISKQK